MDIKEKRILKISAFFLVRRKIKNKVYAIVVGMYLVKKYIIDNQQKTVGEMVKIEKIMQ